MKQIKKFTYYAEIWDGFRNPISNRFPVEAEISGNPPTITITNKIDIPITGNSNYASLNLFINKATPLPFLKQDIGVLFKEQSVTIEQGKLLTP